MFAAGRSHELGEGGAHAGMDPTASTSPSLVGAAFPTSSSTIRGPQGATPIDLTGFTLGRGPLPLNRLVHYHDFVTIAAGIAVAFTNRDCEDWLEGGVRVSGELFLGVPGTVEVGRDDRGDLQVTLHNPDGSTTPLSVTETRDEGPYQSLDQVIFKLPDGREVDVELTGSRPTAQNPARTLSVSVQRSNSLALVATFRSYPEGVQQLIGLRAETKLPSGDQAEVEVAFWDGFPAGVVARAYVSAVGGAPELAVSTNKTDGIDWYSQDDVPHSAALDVLTGATNDIRAQVAALVPSHGA